MSDKKYNGMTNYQTWNFKIWMENDENDYRSIQLKVRECIHNANKEKDKFYKGFEYDKGLIEWHKGLKCRNVAAMLELYAWDWIDNVVSTKASFVNDILRYSISGINFYEIAEHLVDEEEKEMEVA